VLKKIIISCIAVFYLSLSSGLAMNLHFCGNKLEKVQLNSRSIKSCCTQKEGETDNCCKNQAIVIKVSDQHESVSLVKVPGLPQSEAIKPAIWARCSNQQSINPEAGIYSLIKPPPGAIPIHLQLRVFRI
jgi:hypothetical protein